jgi:hypothetical protein
MRSRLLTPRSFGKGRGSVEGAYLAVDTCRVARNPEPPKPAIWNVYKIASKADWLGAVCAPDETAAMEKCAVEIKVAAKRLMAIRR